MWVLPRDSSPASNLCFPLGFFLFYRAMGCTSLVFLDDRGTERADSHWVIVIVSEDTEGMRVSWLEEGWREPGWRAVMESDGDTYESSNTIIF